MSTPVASLSPFARWRKFAWFFWLVLALLVFACAWFPIKFASLRLFMAFGIIALWSGIFLLGWKIKPLRFACLGVSLSAFLFLLLPGLEYSRAELRRDYVSSLVSYNGAQYVWGGESRRGIDCSGLLRCGLIDANARSGLAHLNPGLVREAISLWWHDSSAKAMKEEYRSKTRVLQTAPSLNTLDHSHILPGDFAITSNGVHALVYIGNKTWIEADPGPMQVIKVRLPSKIAWFSMPVHLMRWRQLEDAQK